MNRAISEETKRLAGERPFRIGSVEQSVLRSIAPEYGLPHDWRARGPTPRFDEFLKSFQIFLHAQC